MRRLTVGPWTLEVDSEATSVAYEKVPQGAAAECGCTDCRNWIEQREIALPSEFSKVLREMGVDPSKETEISEFEGGAVDPTLNRYTGEYLVIGRVISGPDCFEETEDGKGATYKLKPFVSDFNVGVSSKLRWAMGQSYLPTLFPADSTAILVFQAHAKRGAIYA